MLVDMRYANKRLNCIIKQTPIANATLLLHVSDARLMLSLRRNPQLLAPLI
jgi:hypothetical protein